MCTPRICLGGDKCSPSFVFFFFCCWHRTLQGHIKIMTSSHGACDTQYALSAWDFDLFHLMDYLLFEHPVYVSLYFEFWKCQSICLNCPISLNSSMYVSSAYIAVQPPHWGYVFTDYLLLILHSCTHKCVIICCKYLHGDVQIFDNKRHYVFYLVSGWLFQGKTLSSMFRYLIHDRLSFIWAFLICESTC